MLVLSAALCCAATARASGLGCAELFIGSATAYDPDLHGKGYLSPEEGVEKGNTFSNFIAGIKAAAMKIDEFRQRDSKKKNSEKEDRRGCNYFQQLFETQRGSSENTENTENIEDTENTENTGAKPNRYPPRYPKQFALPPMPFSEYYNLRN